MLSQRRVFPGKLPTGSDIAFTAGTSTGVPNAPDPGGTWYGMYVNLTASTLDFYIDVDPTAGTGYEGPYTATKL